MNTFARAHQTMWQPDGYLAAGAGQPVMVIYPKWKLVFAPVAEPSAGAPRSPGPARALRSVEIANGAKWNVVIC